MNIVIANVLDFNPQIGGLERVSCNLAVEFGRMGHIVYFVAMRESPYTPYSQNQCKPVVEQMMLPNPLIANCEENFFCFTNYLVEKKIDILINQAAETAEFSNLCMAVKTKTKIKLLSVLHFDPARNIKLYYSDPSLLFYRSWVVRQIFMLLKMVYFLRPKRYKRDLSKLYHQLYVESDAVVLLSDHFKPTYKKIAKLHDISKLKSIPNSLTFSVSEETGLKEKQILWIGRFQIMQKRPERLVKVWSYLEAKYPDWHVLFLGDGIYRPKVEQYVRRLGLKNIRFGGFADPEEAYRKSSIICMTSTYEGFGLVLTEAMQFGVVPMAFSSFESIDDIIKEGVTGYKIKPYDLKQYARQLELLMTDENRRSQMAQNARKHVTEKFNVERITQQWITLFEQVCCSTCSELPIL